MVIVGIPKKQHAIGRFSLTARHHILAGSAIGGIHETQEMLDFCGRHNITSDLEVIPIQKVNEAYGRVLKSDVSQGFVICLASLNACHGWPRKNNLVCRAMRAARMLFIGLRPDAPSPQLLPSSKLHSRGAVDPPDSCPGGLD